MKKRSVPLIAAGSPAVPVGDVSVSIRRDLWLAFNSTNPKKPIRLYDKLEDEAKLLAEAPAPETSGESKQDRFVRIKPIPSSEQKKWAKLFVAKQVKAKSPQMASDLMKLLSQEPREPWHNKFIKQLDKDQDMIKKWGAFKGQKVLERIKKWIDKNGLTLDPTQPKPQPKETGAKGESSELNLKIIRRRLIRAIQKMPLSELMSLKIPVGYLL